MTRKKRLQKRREKNRAMTWALRQDGFDVYRGFKLKRTKVA